MAVIMHLKKVHTQIPNPLTHLPTPENLKSLSTAAVSAIMASEISDFKRLSIRGTALDGAMNEWTHSCKAKGTMMRTNCMVLGICERFDGYTSLLAW